MGLHRSYCDSMIGGVCGGIAESTGIDPTVVRLLWAGITLISGGAGLLAYLLCWMIMPIE